MSLFRLDTFRVAMDEDDVEGTVESERSQACLDLAGHRPNPRRVDRGDYEFNPAFDAERFQMITQWEVRRPVDQEQASPHAILR